MRKTITSRVSQALQCPISNQTEAEAVAKPMLMKSRDARIERDVEQLKIRAHANEDDV